MNRLKLLAARIFVAIAILYLPCSAARADDLFVVVGVEPLTPDIVAGSAYVSEAGSPEFIYVPEGVQIALITEDGQRYIIAGRNAVLADRQSLQQYEIERIKSTNPGFINRLFGIGLPTEFVAATRAFDEEDLTLDPASLADMSTVYVDLLGQQKDKPVFCLFSDTVNMRRSDEAGSIPLTLTIGGTDHQAAWGHGETDVALSGLGLKEGAVAEAIVKKGASERALELVRLDGASLERGLFATIVTLARNGCSIQAMLLSAKMKRQ